MNNVDQTTLLAKHLVNSGHVNASSLSCPHAVQASASLTVVEPGIHWPPSVIVQQVCLNKQSDWMQTLLTNANNSKHVI